MTHAPAEHIPVMLREVVEALAPREGGIYIDGTFGRGGYSQAILSAAPSVRVIGIDRDPDAIAAGAALVDRFAPRLTLVQGTFGRMKDLVDAAHKGKIDGIALDLGVSSPQLDEAERGFSFQEDGPLDMRMSKDTGRTAADIVASATETEIANIIYKYGEEKFSRRVARKIVEERSHAPITRTRQLAQLIRSVVPRSNDGVDPATRSFQALRIAVNDELGELERGLEAAQEMLRPDGRLAIVSFHSLEDRCVKAFLRDHSDSAPRTSRHVPFGGESVKPSFRLLTRKPQVPSATEIEANPRSRSARLRVAVKMDGSVFMEN